MENSMNSDISKALNAVSRLDSWDVQSVLGGVNYIVQQAAINTAVRMLPPLPEEGSGIEGYTAWEQKMREPEIREAVAPIVGIANHVKDVLNEYTDMTPSEYNDVLTFMVQRPPQRATFEAEYNNRKRLGMRPGMPMSVFVDMELAQAEGRHKQLLAKGEAAINLLHSIEGNDASAPEWLYEAIAAKIQQKLEQRWMRAELRRTNPKITKQDRDLAAANQKLIEDVIKELGGEVPSYADQQAAEDEMEAYLHKLRPRITGSQPQ
jgi:hypothetical protein